MSAITGFCRCCGEKTEIRCVNLYVCGSEGLDACHDCEMMLVEHARTLMRIASKGRKIGYKAAKAEGK